MESARPGAENPAVEPASRLFASTGLAARIERAECRMLVAATESVSRTRPGAGAWVRPIGGGVALFAGVGSPLTKVLGLGFSGAVGEAELAAVEAAYDERGSQVQIELSALADPSVVRMLTGNSGARRYTLVGFENVLGRALPVAERRTPDPAIEVRTCAAADFEDWLRVVVDGFLHPDEQGVASHEAFPRATMERVIRDMGCATGFCRYVAAIGGAPVGGAGMWTCDGIAVLCGAATLPAWRRRGVQSALLHQRLQDAGAEGCDIAVTTVMPGSKSAENMHRQGFDPVYARAVLLGAGSGGTA